MVNTLKETMYLREVRRMITNRTLMKLRKDALTNKIKDEDKANLIFLQNRILALNATILRLTQELLDINLMKGK